MTEIRVLKTIALVCTVGFIATVWIDPDETPNSAMLKTLFALVMLMLMAFMASGWKGTEGSLKYYQDRERERTDALIAESQANVKRLRDPFPPNTV